MFSPCMHGGYPGVVLGSCFVSVRVSEFDVISRCSVTTLFVVPTNDHYSNDA